MMWELHEIRHRLALRNETADEINASGRRAMAQLGLSGLKVVSVSEAAKAHKGARRIERSRRRAAPASMASKTLG